MWACSLLAAAVQARDRLGLRFLTNRAGVGLDAFFFSRGFSSYDTVILSMVVGFWYGSDNAAHIAADGAVDFGATLFLAGGLNDTHGGMMAGGVYNVVIVREAVIFVALVHSIQYIWLTPNLRHKPLISVFF